MSLGQASTHGAVAIVTRVLIAALVLAGVAYAAACAYLWARQRQIIFLPTPAALNAPAQIGGATYQSLKIPVGAAGSVAAWWLPSTSAQGARAAVLYLHGNEGNLAREVDRLEALRRVGLPILAIDYRGYGESSGPAPSETRVYEDAGAAWNYMIVAMGLNPAHVVIYGHSLGGA